MPMRSRFQEICPPEGSPSLSHDYIDSPGASCFTFGELLRVRGVLPPPHLVCGLTDQPQFPHSSALPLIVFFPHLGCVSRVGAFPCAPLRPRPDSLTSRSFTSTILSLGAVRVPHQKPADFPTPKLAFQMLFRLSLTSCLLDLYFSIFSILLVRRSFLIRSFL